jgi:hypothetical protein
MSQVDHLIAKLLSQKWVDLFDQTAKQFVDLENAKYPGIYLLAYTDKNLANTPIELQDIFYVGMSNSDGGVKQRLANFVSGIERNKNHSGGMRFYRDYAGGLSFSEFSK